MLIHERYIYKNTLDPADKSSPILPMFVINVNSSANSTGDTYLIWKMHSLIFHSLSSKKKPKKVQRFPSKFSYCLDNVDIHVSRWVKMAVLRL